MIEFLSDLARWFGANWDGDAGWVHRVAEHLWVSAFSLVAAAVVAIPLAAWLGHRGRGGTLAVSLANLGRAVPSFGVVALALPLTIRSADRLPFIDSGLGFAPLALALFVLAIPPIFINTHEGVRTVDADTREAALGMGMSGRSLLATVELPLAMPLIVEGIRISAVQVVATAPLGALVAYGGLGRFIIDGFAQRDSVQVVAGAVLVLVLALAVAVAIGWLGRLVTPAPLRRGNTAPGGGVVAAGTGRAGTTLAGNHPHHGEE